MLVGLNGFNVDIPRSEGENERINLIKERCNIQGMRKVSHSSRNLGRIYATCLRYKKFLGWVDEANLNLEKRLLSEIEIMKYDLRELKMMFKILEKGQSILVMLEIALNHPPHINEKLSDSSDPSNCHSLKSLSSLSSWSLSSSSACSKFSSISLSNISTSPIFGWH
ncbi:hypothetical protein Cgig2_033928 [Carnegiea gigantea]|uniref:Uncharacterized protein n=1 Tax=Carnegiea gigantea TaxID=171969 RepID=A0A9Q1JNV5_9CARY|nr:hypothetical protein Cgig2_033928 [Carnegiea gigantea]